MKSNMWSSHSSFCASAAPSRNDTMVPLKQFGLWLWKVSFSTADVGSFVQEVMVFYDLLWPLLPNLQIRGKDSECRIVPSPLLDIQIYLQPVTDSVADCNRKPISSSSPDNTSNADHLSGWANDSCNISHALHGIFDTAAIVSLHQYSVQYTWYL